MRINSCLAILGLAACLGCHIQWGVDGSGSRVSETRQLESFSSLHLKCAAAIEVAVGDERQSVEMEIDDNLLSLITSEVQNDTLIIGNLKPFRSKLGLKVGVALPSLRTVRVSGSGEVNAGSVNESKFDVEIHGSGDVRVAGTADRARVVIAGSGNVDLLELMAGHVEVEIMGSGDVRVHATEELQVSIKGSGSVRYRGSPHVSQEILGSGDVERID